MTNKKIADSTTDAAVMAALGERLAQLRVSQSMTQAELAVEAGVAKRTVGRVEAGESVQLLTVIRLFRVLGLMEHLDQLVPEQKPSPMTLLKDKMRNKPQQRVRSGKSNRRNMKPEAAGEWAWGDGA